MPWIGILLSLPLGLFSWIGSQTFVRSTDHNIAQFVLAYSALLFIGSVFSLFDASLRIWIDYMVGGAVLIIVVAWALGSNPWLLKLIE